jgi:hypothetical protein
MRLLDGALRGGFLDDGEYMHRAAGIQQAESLEQMNEIVQQIPVLDPSKHRSARSVGNLDRTSETPEQSRTTSPRLAELAPIDDSTRLDPVDVALLMRSAQSRNPAPNRRIGALAVVGLLFLVLIILGVLLAIHDRSANGSSSLVSSHLLFALRYPRISLL